MRTLANILWHFPFLGFITALSSFLLGSLLVLTVVAAPIGLGLVQHSKFLMFPFSSAMVSKKELNAPQNPLWNTYGTIVWILYLPFGILLFLISIVQIAFLFFSIIGIPVAIVLAKSLSTYFNPVHKVCVPNAVAVELEQRKAKAQIDKYLK